MRQIIVGYDGSREGSDGLRLGAELASAFDARLIVASAAEFHPLEIDALGGYAQVRAEHHADIFRQARSELGDTTFERRELDDSPAHGLTELAETLEADAIVIGSTHRGPIGRLFGGSVADRLFHGAPCAVAVAPRGWSRRPHGGVGTIGIAYDGSAESEAALEFAERIARAFDATLRVISVAPYGGVDSRVGPLDMTFEAWQETLQEGLNRVGPGVRSEAVLRRGREATELALQGVEVDLLILGSRGYGPLGRTLIGSVSTEIVRTAPCPVMVIPRALEIEIAEGSGREAVSEASRP